MSKKMWSKIFKSSKTPKNAKLSTANKRCSIYEEYQQLNAQAGEATEAAKKPKKLKKGNEQQQQSSKQQQADEQLLQNMLQQHESSAADEYASSSSATTHVAGAKPTATITTSETTSADKNSATNSELVQALPLSKPASSSKAEATAAALTGANDQLIGHKNNCNANGTGAAIKQQSTFAKVVSSFTLKRSNNANAQQHQKGSGNVNAAGKLPKSEFFQHATPTNQAQQQEERPVSSHALQGRRRMQQQHEKGGDEAEANVKQQQQQQHERRSSQVLIVIKQIVTIKPKMVSAAAAAATATATTTTTTQLSVASCLTAAVTDTVLDGNDNASSATATNRTHSSATPDNVFILAAACTATTATTTTASSQSTPTTTTSTITTTSTNTNSTCTTTTTNTRMQPVEKNNSNTIANTADPHADAPKLVPCLVCRRTFNPVTLQKHVGICEKMATKKRNIFDSSRQRREGTELASYPLPKNFGLSTAKLEPRGQSPKPLQHIASPILTRKKSSGVEELARSTARASMRKLAATTATTHNQSPSSMPTNAAAAAHTANNNQMIASTSSTTSLPGAGSSFTRDRMRSSDRSLAKRNQPPPAEQCPHCERCFGLKAYDRHVEWCKEKALQASIKHTTKTEQNLAKERLEARTKYRAPCLKTKRSINRDKYAGLAGDELEIGDSLKASYGSHNNNNSNHSSNTSSSLQNGVGSHDIANNYSSTGSGNGNGIMSLSMTSSLTSERKPVVLKDFHSTMRTRKTHRNAAELPPPSPSRRAVIGIDDYVKSACFDNCRLMGAKLAAHDTITKRAPKRRVTLNALSMQQPQSQPQQVANYAPPQSQQFQKIRTRNNDDRMTVATSDQTREQCLGDANALSATLTYTSCPLKVVSKSSTPPRLSELPSNSITTLSKPKSKLKPKIPSEPSIRVDAGTVMTDHDEEPRQRSEVRNSQSYEMMQTQSKNQELQRYSPPPLTQPLTPPMQMLQKRQTTFDKLPNTTIAVTTVETATASSTTASHTKLEVNAIRSLTICRPKRKKLVRHSVSAHAAPMKAIPLIKESIEIFGMPTKLFNNGGEQQKDNDSRILADDETEDEIKVIKAPPMLARDQSFVLSGLLSDKYDPFLSAKRQLEELCSSSPPNNPSFSANVTKTSPQTPSAGLPAKMSTSLTLSTSTPNYSPLATNSQYQRLATTPSMTTNKTPSNFRRTSSLRGPRRSPMLSSRPLFAQNHRPTIQRGLSDEGPISTNFLKTEEYDEMPVRSVCVNDYAVTKSPRVARRDNSLSNRKQSLKLNVQGAATSAATSTSTTNTPNCSAMLGVNSSDELINSAAKYLSKTDSLAAFLKYENELEKLNAQAAAVAGAKSSTQKTIEESVHNTPATNVHSPVITKEFKDKSNTLSKQNSAKSIKAEQIESPKRVDQEHSYQHLPTPVTHAPPTAEISPYERETVNIQKTQQLRLEPIALPQATSTPITKQAAPTQLPLMKQAVSSNGAFSESKPPSATSLAVFSKDGKSFSGNEYIDPKLINKCDNLPVNLNSVRTLKSIGDNSNAERRLDFSSSSECSATQTGPISQLTKLLPLTKPADVQQAGAQMAPAVATPSQAMDIPTRPSTADEDQPNAHPTLSQRSSAEGKNLLNRKKRLGRNHFLYDASPEADDSCSADDEANRSSVEYYESKYRSSYQQQPQPQTCFVNTRGQYTTLKTPPIIPPLPIFDDFDFEEFLSSFENDDEQFPLFKDCKEFLLNRTSNKQRSTLTPNSIYTNSNNNNSNKTQNHTTQTKDYNLTNNHIQLPSLNSNKQPYPIHQLTPSSRRSRDESRPKSKESSPTNDRSDELNRATTQSGAYGYDGTTKRHADSEHKKREIFISIETEPNELGRSPISPDSLRNMVGNPQTMVEVEVDGCDNKFSKISDDDEQLAGGHVGSKGHHAGDMMLRCAPFASGNHLPNVQLNNAKNLIQRMQDDFRQMSEEVGANIRQAMTGLNSNADSASMQYGGAHVGIGAGVGGRGGTYVPRHNNTSPPSSTPATVGAAAPMYAASEDVSGDACGDSDDMSSLDGYPISSKSSRRGVGSKLSADSAYGSLSRQRSSELSTTPHRSAARSRPSASASTASNTAPLATMLADTTTQHQPQQQQQHQYHYQQQQQLQQQQLQQPAATQLYKYAPVKMRPRRISGSSSSDNSDSIDGNSKYKQQQQQQLYKNNSNNSCNNNNYIGSHYAPHHSLSNSNSNSNDTNNNNNYDSSLSSPTMPTTTKATGTTATTAAPTTDELPAQSTNNKGQYSSSSSLSSTNAAMSASMKMSKFCHECGAKFLVEQAKFCMDCGIRRIVL